MKNDWLYKFKKAQIVEKNEKIIHYCKQKKVLDVGCVGQDKDFNNPNWLHKKISEVAQQCTGVDIDTKGIEILRKNLYTAYHVSELQKVAVKYDIIVMADVIEHVDNAVEFLLFYAQFLAKDGKIIITTPNAKRAIDIVNILFSNNFWVNDEHTLWYCPKTILEIIQRAKMEPIDFFWLKEYAEKSQKTTFKLRILNIMSRILMRLRRMFYPNFMIIIKQSL